MEPLKEAVSLVITDNNKKFLAVKRPDDPSDDLAGVWGFPAVTLQEGESHEDAAARVGLQKLGVYIKLGKKIGDSTHDRGAYALLLTDYNAEITKGTPVAPQSDTSVTQYSEYVYADDPTILIPAAKRGSQCTQLFLKSVGIDWENQ